jgi:hypothetical protein
LELREKALNSEHSRNLRIWTFWSSSCHGLHRLPETSFTVLEVCWRLRYKLRAIERGCNSWPRSLEYRNWSYPGHRHSTARKWWFFLWHISQSWSLNECEHILILTEVAQELSDLFAM